MNEAFSNRTAQIFVVESNAEFRQAVGDALGELGFENNLRFSSLSEVIPLFQADNIPDWLITPLGAADEINAFHFLEYYVKNEKFHRCRISLLLDDGDMFCVREAFQMGILSFHARDAVTLPDSLKKLLKTMESYGWDPCLSAYDAIMNLLLAGNDHEEMDRLVKSLILIHEDAGAVNIKYAECLLAQGLLPRGLMVLRHVEATASQYAGRALQLREQYIPQAVPDEEELTFAAGHGIKTVMVVDPDEASLNTMGEILGHLGVENIACFPDGAAAWNHLAEMPPPELVIMEWKIPKLSGAALLQRIRIERKIDAPVVIYSAAVTEKDRLLLREMGVTDIIQKPLYEKLLTEELKATIIHEYSDSDIVTTERKIRAKLRAKDLGGAGTLLESLSQNPRTPTSLKEHLEAELLLLKGEVIRAKDLAIQSLNAWGETPLLLDLIGKILLSMREYGLSKVFFDKAAGIIPANIERLCALAETHNELGDAKGADARLGEAQKVDGQSEIIAETKAVISIQQGDIDLAKALMTKISHSENVVSRLNNKAVYLVNQDKVEEAITLYERAIEALDKGSRDLMAIVYYNMGLSYARQSRLPKALESLHKSTAYESSRVFHRAKSLEQRVKKSKETGKSLVLYTSKRDSNEPGDCFVPIAIIQSTSPLPLSPTAKPGSLCCHIIFQCKREVAESVLKLFQKPPLALMPSEESVMTIS